MTTSAQPQHGPRLAAHGLCDAGSDYLLHVETQGGITDLGRIVNVLALYDLTPLGMVVRPAGEGLWIDLRLRGDARVCALCAGRLVSLTTVNAAELTPAPPGPGALRRR